MKFLISTPRDPNYCLVGYDWEENRVFWAYDKHKYRKMTLGLCYENGNLLTASFNNMCRLTPDSRIKAHIREGFGTRLHSVHDIGNGLVGVANPADDCINIVNRKGELVGEFNLRVDGDLRYDVYHLNDFAMTESGILATIFGYRPWRVLRDQLGMDVWRYKDLGMVVNVTDEGRAIACGLNVPHSINENNGFIYVCSSHSGTLHCYEQGHILKEIWARKFTPDKFLRGMYFIGRDEYFIGACRIDHTEQEYSSEIFYVRGDRLQSRTTTEFSGIYDILPWEDRILDPIINKHFT